MACQAEKSNAFRIINLSVKTFDQVRETLRKYRELGETEVSGLSLEGKGDKYIKYRTRGKVLRFSKTAAAVPRVMVAYPTSMSVRRLTEMSHHLEAII